MKINNTLRKTIVFALSIILLLSMASCSNKKNETEGNEVMARVNGIDVMSKEVEAFTNVYLLLYMGADAADQVAPEELEQFQTITMANMIIDGELIKEYLKDVDVLTEESNKEIEDTILQLREGDPSMAAALERLQISDDTIKKFFEYNLYTQAFMTKVEEETVIDDAMIEEYYNEHKVDFISPASISASHILMGTAEHTDEDRQAVEAVLERINNGEDFAELATELSSDPGSAANGGDLGVVTKGQMVIPFEEALFGLSNGEVSGIVESEFGFHIIKATSDLSEEVPMTIEEATEQIIIFLKNDATMAKLTELREAADIEYITAIDPSTLDDGSDDHDHSSEGTETESGADASSGEEAETESE